MRNTDSKLGTLESTALLAVVLLSSCPLSRAQVAVPATPAGQVLAAMLTAFNSGDPAQIAAFDKTYRQTSLPVDFTLRIRERTGGFTLMKVERSEPRHLVAVLKEVDADTLTAFDLHVSDEATPRVTRQTFHVLPPSPESAPVRLAQAAALSGLADYLSQRAKGDKFSGAMVIARHGTILFGGGWGDARREGPVPVTLQSRFRIASMSKMFTAVAVLQLAEAGKLRLDDSVGTFLVDYPDKDVAGKVTIRHLLTHSGGTGDIFGEAYLPNRLSLNSNADYIRLLGRQPLVHEPGARHQYSNYGFVLLGAIIEKASGMTYYDYIDRHIYRPAGMTRSGSLPETVVVPDLAHGYTRKRGQWVSNDDWLPARASAAGGSWSTVGDLLSFAQALQSGKLISGKSLDEALRYHSKNYGYGFGLGGDSASRYYGHGGAAPGMSGELRIYPASAYVIIALSNLDMPAAQRAVEFFTSRMPID